MARPLGHAPHTITLKLSRNICVGVYTSKNMNGLVSQHQRPKGTGLSVDSQEKRQRLPMKPTTACDKVWRRDRCHLFTVHCLQTTRNAPGSCSEIRDVALPF